MTCTSWILTKSQLLIERCTQRQKVAKIDRKVSVDITLRPAGTIGPEIGRQKEEVGESDRTVRIQIGSVGVQYFREEKIDIAQIGKRKIGILQIRTTLTENSEET